MLMVGNNVLHPLCYVKVMLCICNLCYVDVSYVCLLSYVVVLNNQQPITTHLDQALCLDTTFGTPSFS